MVVSVMNLLWETTEALKARNLTPADVVFVVSGHGSHTCTWDEFADLASYLYYDHGYGAAQIDDTLKIVGHGWWLERGEYDGSEWWEFRCQPSHIDNPSKITDLRQHY